MGTTSFRLATAAQHVKQSRKHRAVNAHAIESRLRRLSAALNLALVVLVPATIVSGYIASWLAVTEFAAHRYSALAMTVAVAAHVGLHWRSLVAQFRRWRERQPAPAPPHVRTAAGYSISPDETAAASGEALVGGTTLVVRQVNS